MTTHVTGILPEIGLLGPMPAEDLRSVAAVSRLRSLRRGQVLFTRSDPSDTVTIVLCGRVKVVIRSADGDELSVAIIQAGGLFGELGGADGGPRASDAETAEACQLLLIPRETVQDICGHMPSAARALATSIEATLRRLTKAAADLVFLDLPHRPAKVLLSQPTGEDGVLPHKTSQGELVHQVGETRQSVNAALDGFDRRGWIKVRDRAITVNQATTLGRFRGHRCVGKLTATLTAA